MQARFFRTWLIICSAGGLLLFFVATVGAETTPESFNFESNISILHADLSGITLGNDPLFDRRIDDEITLDFEMKYRLTDQLFVFLGGSFFDENETLKTSNDKSSESGFEREQTGIGYLWGDDTEFEFAIGRLEYSDERQWWWDEFLDSIRLQIDQDDFSFLLAHGRELGRSRSNLDFIDPEEEGIKRSLAQLEWDISDNHQLVAYYLRQVDRSASNAPGEPLDENRVDAEDANLHWLGLSYLGQISHDSLGDIEFTLGYTQVNGNATVYEFLDVGGNLEVDTIDQFDLDAYATEVSINWVPEFNPDLKFIASRALGSGDKNTSDSRIETFRQTGLHGNEADFLYYGELYQPELSNIRIESIGVSFEGIDRFTIALMRHEYRQDELDNEMRDVAIDFLNTPVINRKLGTEIDLIIQYEALDGLDFKFIGAEFKAGKAYGIYAGEKSRYWSLEMDYQF